MKLSTNFTLEELTASATAKVRGISNRPSLEVLGNLKRLADELEKVRHALGDKPLHIHSGYRSPNLNAAVGGSKSSYHMLGLAADFDPPSDMTHDEAQHILALLADLDYDLILEEKAKDGAHWIHLQVSKEPGKGRRLVRDAELDRQGGSITRTHAG